MSIIGWIVVGLIAGGLARWIVKDDRSGCIYTMIVGVLGAMIGGWLMSIIDSNGVDEFSLRSIGVAAIGAVLLLLVLQADRWAWTEERRLNGNGLHASCVEAAVDVDDLARGLGEPVGQHCDDGARNRL